MDALLISLNQNKNLGDRLPDWINKIRHERKILNKDKKVKLSLLTDDMIIYAENLKNLQKD